MTVDRRELRKRTENGRVELGGEDLESTCNRICHQSIKQDRVEHVQCPHVFALSRRRSACGPRPFPNLSATAISFLASSSSVQQTLNTANPRPSACVSRQADHVHGVVVGVKSKCFVPSVPNSHDQRAHRRLSRVAFVLPPSQLIIYITTTLLIQNHHGLIPAWRVPQWCHFARLTSEAEPPAIVRPGLT